MSRSFCNAESSVARKIFYGSLIVMALALVTHQAVVQYAVWKGVTFQSFEPSEYKSFVNNNFSHARHPLVSVLSKMHLTVLGGFLSAVVSYAVLRKKNTNDRLGFVLSVVLFIFLIKSSFSEPWIKEKQLVEKHMNHFSLGLVDPEDSFGGKWTGVLNLNSPEFDKIIVHNMPTLLRAVVGIKEGKVVSYFLYSERLGRYKILDVDLIENDYKSRIQMWERLIKAKPVNDLGKLIVLQRTFSGQFDTIKTKEPTWIFKDVLDQFYDDNLEITKIIDPQTHILSRLDISREALRTSR